MTVYRRETSGGESKFFCYRFMLAGKSYHGSCIGKDGKKATKKTEAEAYEKKIRLKTRGMSEQKTKKAFAENFRNELFGGGEKVALDDAFSRAMKKPRRKSMSSSHRASKESCWRDFVAFMTKKFSEVEYLGEVKHSHAEEYIHLLRTQGRFDKEIALKVNKKDCSYESKIKKLSNRTCNVFQSSLREVFTLLAKDASVTENPFSGITMLDNEYETREAFTEKELVTIGKKAGWFIRSLFAIGMNTALREGDICTLKWGEVDLANEVITRKMRKTGKVVEIPIMPPLRTILEECKEHHPDSKEYVLPEHAEIYLAGNGGISYRVRKFLESLKIKTLREVDGRSRAVSVKDVHSLRHTYCFLAGMYGIPLIIVQSIVGHMTAEMTAHYQKHAQMQDKKKMLSALPDFLQIGSTQATLVPAIEPEREELIELARSLPVDTVRKVIEFAKSNQ